MIYSIVLYRGETARFPYACDYIVCKSFIQRTSPVYYLVFISCIYRFGPHFNHLLSLSLITRETWKTSSTVPTDRQTGEMFTARVGNKQSECKQDGNPCVHNGTTPHQCKYGHKLSFRGCSKKTDYCFPYLILFNVFLFFVYSKGNLCDHMTSVFVIKMKAKPFHTACSHGMMYEH